MLLINPYHLIKDEEINKKVSQNWRHYEQMFKTSQRFINIVLYKATNKPWNIETPSFYNYNLSVVLNTFYKNLIVKFELISIII